METDQAELLKFITSFLEEHHLEYMITGSLAVIYYGRPRASHDIDFVVEVPQREVKATVKALQKLAQDYMVDAAGIREAIAKKDQFNLLHYETMLKLDFWLVRDEPFDKLRFSRRQKVAIFGQEMVMSTPEDTILQKLRWYQMGKIEKHLVDAAFVLQIQKDNLDRQYLEKWAKKLKIEKDFRELGEINLEDYL